MDRAESPEEAEGSLTGGGASHMVAGVAGGDQSTAAEISEDAEHGGGDYGALAAPRQLISVEKGEGVTTEVPVVADLSGERRSGRTACRRRR